MDIERLDAYLSSPDARLKTRITLASSFELYLKFIFLAINGTNITIKPFHSDIIKKLEDIVFQKNTKRNLCINIPVGAGKSLLIEYFISWCFAIDINNAFVYVSHSDTLINKLSKETKDIVSHPVWQSLFCAELKKDERSKVNWSFENSKNRTGLTAGTIGGAITGLDAGNPNIDGFSGALIIDDPVDAGNIKYELARQECIGFYENKLATRRRTANTPTILVMQRLHPEDLSGYLRQNYEEDWDFVIIPALDEDNKSFWEERYPSKDLLVILDKNANTFFAQYQQQPILDGGNLLKVDWFGITESLPPKFDYRFITADTAYKEKEQNDYTVFCYWGVKYDNGIKKLYLLDVKRKRIKSIDIESWIEPWIKQKVNYGFRYIWIEDKGHGIYLNQSFRTKGYNIPTEEKIKETLPRERDKVERANNVMPFINKLNYNILFYKDIEGIEDLKLEIASFPNGKHDDFVDCLIDAIKVALAEEDVVKKYTAFVYGN
jgi:predicted phage terminase large subunit-like protein